MTTFARYTELVTTDKRPEIFAVREVVATEKLHGSNFRVYFPAGMTSPDDLVFGSRNETFAEGDTGFYGGRPQRWFRERRDLVERVMRALERRGLNDVVLFGEVCGSSVQRGVRYAADGELIFRAFDILVGECFVTYDLFVEICEESGLPRVPEIWRGPPSREAFDALLEQRSAEGERNGVGAGENVAEGVVIRSNPLLRNVFGEWLIIKHKAKKYREATPPKERKTAEKKGTSPADDFVATYVVEGRLINAIGRLKDRGAFHGTMEDVPVLADAVIADLHKEEEPQWQSVVAAGQDDRQIRAAVMKTVARLYREMLARGEV